MGKDPPWIVNGWVRIAALLSVLWLGGCVAGLARATLPEDIRGQVVSRSLRLLAAVAVVGNGDFQLIVVQRADLTIYAIALDSRNGLTTWNVMKDPWIAVAQFNGFEVVSAQVDAGFRDDGKASGAWEPINVKGPGEFAEYVEAMVKRFFTKPARLRTAGVAP